jgi:two-component system, NtrC family, response regulator
MDRPKLLILEDDDGLRRQYRWALGDEWHILATSTRQEALKLLPIERPPVAIVDLGLPPDPDGASEGLAALQQILQRDPATKVVIATGNETKEYALKAVAAGAYDFYQKPIDIDVLKTILDRALRLYRLEEENRRLQVGELRSAIEGLITASPEMLRVCRSIERVAPTDVSVLLLGESGTGKELLARAVHQLSPRAKHPFIAINCGAIPENLLESELFGHEKGAFTGAVKTTIGKVEQSHKGTLFLDEIGDLPLPLQVKLLRFLQSRVIERVGGRTPITVDTRIVCATHQDLQSRIGDGLFREDLFYRLNEMVVTIPPLRERGEDAVLLASFFLKRFVKRFDRRIKGFTPDAIAAIAAAPWRGNVRELENRVKRAVIMAEGAQLGAADLDLDPTTGEDESESLDLRAARTRAEQKVVLRALAQAHGNMSTAAKLLRISRPTLYSLLEAHGLNAPSAHRGTGTGTLEERTEA